MGRHPSGPAAAGGSIYRSERGERRIKQAYRRLLEGLEPAVERRWVETDVGVTHLLVTGDADAPPLVVFHGGNMINPVSLAWFLPLADTYRLLAPDTIGQPGFSAEVRPPPGSDGHARWVVQLLDGLGLGRVPMIGPSYGGGIVLRTATHAPDRVARAGLIVPAGLGTAPLHAIARSLLWPALKYRLIPSRPHLEGVLEALFTADVADLDEHTVDLIGTVMREVRLDGRLPPAATAADLAGFDAPTFVAAATDDVLFPASTVLPRARAVLPNLDVTVRLDGERHIPGPRARDRLLRYLRAFLADT